MLDLTFCSNLLLVFWYKYASVSLDVSVCMLCYNKIPETGQFIKNKNLFLTVLEAGLETGEGSSLLPIWRLSEREVNAA